MQGASFLMFRDPRFLQRLLSQVSDESWEVKYSVFY